MPSPSDPTVLDRELIAEKPLLAREGMTVAERYTLVACRGRGGIGEVWEATQAPTGRRVALKLLLPGWWPHDTVRQRFVQEGRLASTLLHRHIVEIFEVGESREGQPFIAMELVRGPPLHKVVEAQGPMPWSRVRRVVLQICDALEHAHALDIIHRDVKPSNVMLATADAESDRCKLVDFGIAKQNLAHGEPVEHLTGEGQMLGSPGFMCPEQLKGRPTDKRGDVYGLGCTAFYLLTGQVPFPGNSVHELIHNALYGEPRALDAVDLEEPLRQEVQEVLHRAVDRDPCRRFDSMLDFVVAINQIGTRPARPRLPRKEAEAERGSSTKDTKEVPQITTPGEGAVAERSASAMDVVDPAGPGSAAEEPTTIPTGPPPRGVVSTQGYSPVLAGRSAVDRVSWRAEEGFVEVARIVPDIVVVQMSGHVGPGAEWLFGQHLGPLIARNRPVRLFWHLGAMEGYPASVREASLRALTEHRKDIESVHLLSGPGVVGMAVSLATVTLGIKPDLYDDQDEWLEALDACAHDERR